jgi:hypothetical protein
MELVNCIIKSLKFADIEFVWKLPIKQIGDFMQMIGQFGYGNFDSLFYLRKKYQFY